MRAAEAHSVANSPSSNAPNGSLRRRFAEHGVRAAEMRAPSDLQRIPLLDKAEVMADSDALLSRGGGSALLTRKATGGSTGERMVFYRDAAAMARNFAHVLRNHTWAGLRLGDRHALLWGAHFDLDAQRRLSNQVINFCLRQRWLDAFHMSRDSMRGYVDLLRRWRPALLSSYVTAATTLADHVLESGNAPLDLPAVVTTAESLFPEHRAKIRRSLSGAVFDRLGCREIGNTAHECPAHDGLHVNAEHVVVEIVDGDGRPVPPGVEGDVLYTSLGNLRFPLVRYRVGDRAVAAAAGACRCGRELPKLAQVRGRITDMLVTPSGAKVHGEYFSHVFYAIDEVAEFRVVQESRDAVTLWLRLRGSRALAPDVERRVRQPFSDVFGGAVAVAIRVVDEIPKSASGKHRFTESRLHAGSAA
jgi:phenylacetate-CoA ligase